MKRQHIPDLQHNDSQNNDIQIEYTRIDGHWLNLHYKISVGLVVFAFLVECIISLIVINSDLLTTTLPRYVAKYILIPNTINLICIWVDTYALKLDHITQKTKIYIVSMMFTVICFVLFTAHNIFILSFFVFAISIVLTVVYANYHITIYTSIVSLFLLNFSEIFIKWDVDKESIFNNTLRLSNFLIANFVLVAFTIICAIVIKYEIRKNLVNIQVENERKLLEQRLKLDELTGISNRKALYDMLKDIDDNKDETFILSIIDIDKFKDINDRFGHQVGDLCLIEFSKLLRNNSVGAIPYRYAGDEFCLLFYNVDIGIALNMCEQLREKTKELYINNEVTFTASFGLSQYDKETGAAQLFVRADQALYKAKVERDSVEII